MSAVVILDTTPLGMVTNPKSTTETDACQQWLRDLLAQGRQVVVPEIADYEVRRELLRARKQNGLKRLDIFVTSRGSDYLPLTTGVMRQAAGLWAQARQQGIQTASDVALDGDMILIAQAFSLGLGPEAYVIATQNVSDIARFAPAKEWKDIVP